MKKTALIIAVVIATTGFVCCKSIFACEIGVPYPHSECVFIIGGGFSIEVSPNTCDTDVRLDLYKGAQMLCTITEIGGKWHEWRCIDCGGGAGSDYRIKATCFIDTTCYDFSDYFTIEEGEQPDSDRPIIFIPSNNQTCYTNHPINYYWVLPGNVAPDSVVGYEFQINTAEDPNAPWEEILFIESGYMQASYDKRTSRLYWHVRFVADSGYRSPWTLLRYHQVVSPPPASGIYWKINKTGEVADTIFIDVSLSESPACGYSSCGFTRGSMLVVSPCPIDQICPDGIYTLNEDTYIVASLKLLKGVTYRFSGSWSYSGQYDGPGAPCGNDCFESGAVSLTQYPDDYVSTSQKSWGAIKSMYYK